MTNGTHTQKRTVHAVMAERVKSASDGYDLKDYDSLED